MIYNVRSRGPRPPAPNRARIKIQITKQNTKAAGAWFALQQFLKAEISAISPETRAKSPLPSWAQITCSKGRGPDGPGLRGYGFPEVRS